MPRAPALFLSHGSPMFALQPGRLGPQLCEIGGRLRGLRAVLVVSPHWQTTATVKVQATARPETIHDFGGFPRELFELRYAVSGAPEVATEALRLLADTGFTVASDDRRGLDHGAWVPLRHLLPDGEVPVLQVSMPHHLAAADALRLGHALAPLRDAGVLLVGSGSLTHNLHEFRRHVRDPEYAQQFADWIADALARNDIDAVLDYRRRAPHATRAHPTEEHFLPLLVALGAADGDSPAQRIEGGLTDGTLSMDSYGWGLDPQPRGAP